MGLALSKADDIRVSIELAHQLVTDAIRELDRVGAPADLGAHLDLALHRMTDALAVE